MQLLEKVESRQESIQRTSQMCHNVYSSAQVATAMETCFDQSPVSHKLNLLYLANEMLQTKTPKLDSFVDALTPFVSRAMPALALQTNNAYLPKVARILEVWQQRNVLSVRAREQISQSLASISTNSSPSNQTIPPLAATSPLSASPRPPANETTQQLKRQRSAETINVYDPNAEMTLIHQVAAKLDVPESYAALFDAIKQAERESVSNALEGESFKTCVKNCYKAVKQFATARPQLAQHRAALAQLPVCAEEDRKEAEVDAIGPNHELLEKVAVNDAVEIEVDYALRIIDDARPRVERIQRAQDVILSGLVQALEDSADPVDKPQGVDDAKAVLERLQNLDDKLAKVLDEVKQRQENEVRVSALYKAQQLLASVANATPAWPPMWPPQQPAWSNNAWPAPAAPAAAWGQPAPMPMPQQGWPAQPGWGQWPPPAASAAAAWQTAPAQPKPR